LCEVVEFSDYGWIVPILLAGEAFCVSMYDRCGRGWGIFKSALWDVGAFSGRVVEADLAHVKLNIVLVREMYSQEIINGIWFIESEFIIVA
jgi:hypothetical protein